MCLCVSQEPREHLLATMYARLYLLRAAQAVMHRALRLLGITPISQMWNILPRSNVPYLLIWKYCIFSTLLFKYQKTTPKCILIYSLQSLTDCHKIWYMLSWVNLSYRNVNVLRLTWRVSLPYLVKLSIHILQVNSSQNCEPKKCTKMFLSYLLQNEANSDKVSYMFFWLNLP